MRKRSENKIRRFFISNFSQQLLITKTILHKTSYTPNSFQKKHLRSPSQMLLETSTFSYFY